MINVKTLIDLLLHQYHPSVCVQSIVIEDAPVGASVVIKTRATSGTLGSESTFLLPLEEAERRYGFLGEDE